MKLANEGRHIPILLMFAAFLAFSLQQRDSQIFAQETAGTQAKSDTGTIAAGKFQLRYRIEGTGTPAIVIGSAVYYPRVFSQNLRKRLRLVFLDHRGFAPSPGPVDTAEFALDTILDDIERARKELELGRVAIIGQSGHALMALEYAKKYPANVSQVIMIANSPNYSAAFLEANNRYWEESVSPERKAILKENRQRVPDEKIDSAPPDEQFAKWYIREGPRFWYDPRFDSSPLWEGVQFNRDVYHYVWGRVFRDIDITQGRDTLIGRYSWRSGVMTSFAGLHLFGTRSGGNSGI